MPGLSDSGVWPLDTLFNGLLKNNRVAILIWYNIHTKKRIFSIHVMEKLNKVIESLEQLKASQRGLIWKGRSCWAELKSAWWSDIDPDDKGNQNEIRTKLFGYWKCTGILSSENLRYRERHWIDSVQYKKIVICKLIEQSYFVINKMVWSKHPILSFSFFFGFSLWSIGPDFSDKPDNKIIAQNRYRNRNYQIAHYKP